MYGPEPILRAVPLAVSYLRELTTYTCAQVLNQSPGLGKCEVLGPHLYKRVGDGRACGGFSVRRRLATFKPKLARLGLVVPAGGYFELPLLLKYCGRQRGAVVYRHSFRAKEYSAGCWGPVFLSLRAVSPGWCPLFLRTPCVASGGEPDIVFPTLRRRDFI